MKQFFVLAAGAILSTSPVAAQPTPAVEYLPAPMMNGQPAPFSSAVRVGDTLYLSGTLGFTPEGKLPEGIEAQTKQTMENIGATLKRAGASFDDVFHCTAFLADMKDWPAFNGVYVTYFKPDRRPARSAFGANGLAAGALLELECQAYAGAK